MDARLRVAAEEANINDLDARLRVAAEQGYINDLMLRVAAEQGYINDLMLRVAAEQGNINDLYKCIRADPNVLKKFDEDEFADTPLHVAAAGGHADFAIAIFNFKPSFARKLNQDIYSPIHLALQNGHTTTVLRLLDTDRELVRVKGKNGYTVLHQATESGDLELLAQFLKICPASIEDVTIQNETAFHIAAKRGQFEALELLCRWLQRSNLYSKVSRKHLFNSKDKDGDTVLHKAASPIQTQMIKILVDCGADRKATNTNGNIALDIIKSQPDTEDKAISLRILGHGCFNRFMKGLIPRRINKPLNELLRSKISFGERLVIGSTVPLLNLSADKVNVLLVILALILTATFQAVHSPPGGVWQGDAGDKTSIDNNNWDKEYNYIGSSIMAPRTYSKFSALNMLLFAYATFFTVLLIAVVVEIWFIVTFVEILLSAFASCFLIAVFVIDPSRSVEVTGRLLPVWFVAMLAAMEIVRILTCRCRRLMGCFRKV